MKFFLRMFNKLSERDKVFFAKRMSFLLKAGVPILESLEIIEAQAKNELHRIIFRNLIIKVSGGSPLSVAMAVYKKDFGNFAVSIIQVGEQSGILSENFKYLADELQKNYNLRKKVQSAMMYPSFIFGATLIMVTILTVVVFPKVLPVFGAINIQLPVTTKILIFLSKFLLSYGFYLLLFICAALIFVSWLLSNIVIKKKFQNLIFKIPVAGKISQSYLLSNFCRTMGMLLKSSVRIDQALIITYMTTENLVYKSLLELAIKVVQEGRTISSFLKMQNKYFPEILSNMLAVGERSGNLSDTFLYLAELYEQDLDELTKNLSGILEPVLMVTMGLMVGFVAISIITPIYSVTQKLTK